MGRERLNSNEMLAVMRLLADAAALKGDPPAQRQLLADGMRALIDADNGFFYVADGWQPSDQPRFSHLTLTTQTDAAYLRYLGEFGARHTLKADPYCFRSIQDPSKIQTWTAADVLPDRHAERRFPDFVDLIRSCRHVDGVVGLVRQQQADRIVGFALHRLSGRKPLTNRDVALATFALRELQRLVNAGSIVLAPQLPPELSARLRQVLDLMLAGLAPKQMARKMGLSLWTVREHIQRLYKRVGVSGREELMARFIGEAVRPDSGNS